MKEPSFDCPFCGQKHLLRVKFCPETGKVVPDLYKLEAELNWAMGMIADGKDPSELDLSPEATSAFSQSLAEELKNAAAEENSPEEFVLGPIEDDLVDPETENPSPGPDETHDEEGNVVPASVDAATSGELTPPVEALCPHCGEAIDKDWTSCAYCGGKLKSSRPAWLIWVLAGGGAIMVLMAIGGLLYLLSQRAPDLNIVLFKTKTPTPTMTLQNTFTPTVTKTPRPTATVTPTLTPTPIAMPDFVDPAWEKSYSQLCAASYFQAKGQLYYACQLNSGAWRGETVDSGGVGLFPSLSFDENETAYISYYDEPNGNLKFAVKEDTEWEIEVVDEDGDVGKFPAQVVDGEGRVLAAYYDLTRGMLKFAFREDGLWQIQDIDQVGSYDGFESIGLALDQAGRPWISYYDSDEKVLKAASFEDDAWEIQVVDSSAGAGRYSSLAMDMDGFPGISYQQHGETQLQYAHFNGQGWDYEIVDTKNETGLFTSLVFGSDNEPRISYFNDDRDDVKYAAHRNELWYVQTVDTYRNVGFYTDIVLNAKDIPYIAYYYYSGSTMRISNLYDGSWNIKPGTTAAESGLYPSLAFK